MSTLLGNYTSIRGRVLMICRLSISLHSLFIVNALTVIKKMKKTYAMILVVQSFVKREFIEF